ncbi:MAG: hypothetical protein IJX20_05660 [Alphaproteobacteria bacterium]|nr:hypothetical protein [Alphaproteobacteria bacterium]MBQ8870787.1 hypothetical protein [Alphaproteobacteria bacterium]
MLKIREYQSREEIESDYENFVSDWKYDAKTQRGEHKSGLKVSRQVLDREILTYENLPEWEVKQKQEGLSDEDILKYRRCLKNQFIIMYEKNPYQKQYTWEDLDKFLKDIKKSEQWTIKCARENGRTEEEIQEMLYGSRKYNSNHYEKIIKQKCAKNGKNEEDIEEILKTYHKKYDKIFGER